MDHHNPRTNSATAAAEQDFQKAATAATSHGTCFSRSTGLPVTMGKSTEELKTKVPDAVKAAFTSLACSLGLTESELLRSMVMVRLYGVEGAQRMHLDHFRAAAGIGHEPAPFGEVSR